MATKAETKTLAEEVKAEPKKITREFLLSMPWVQPLIDTGKEKAEEEIVEPGIGANTDAIYYVVWKDGTYMIVAVFGNNNLAYSEQTPIEADPEYIRQQGISAHAPDRIMDANIVYTIEKMRKKVRAEIALKNNKSNSGGIKFKV